MTNSRSMFATFALGLAAIAAIPAAANDQVAVDASHLDLASAAGQKALDTQLRAAVNKVCGIRPVTTDLQTKRSHRECASDARASYAEQRRIAITNARGGDRMAVSDAASARVGG